MFCVHEITFRSISCRVVVIAGLLFVATFTAIEEHAEEPYVLTDDLLLEGAHSWGIALSLFRGALDAHLAPAHASPLAATKRRIGSTMGSWTLFVPTAILTIWLLDQPGRRSFPIQLVKDLLAYPTRFRGYAGGFEEATTITFTLGACVVATFFLLSFTPVIISSLRRASIRSLAALPRAVMPAVLLTGIVIGLVALQSAHVYQFTPLHHASAASSFPFQYGWNLSATGLFLLATPVQIASGAEPNLWLLTLITLGEAATVGVIARQIGRFFTRSLHSSRMVRFEIVSSIATTLGMALVWFSLVAWVAWEYLSPATSARYSDPFAHVPALYFSGFALIPLVLMATFVLFAGRSSHQSISSWHTARTSAPPRPST
jgi:hypothetical protein